jgi:hypothetical protein
MKKLLCCLGTLLSFAFTTLDANADDIISKIAIEVVNSRLERLQNCRDACFAEYTTMLNQSDDEITCLSAEDAYAACLDYCDVH